MMMNNWNSGIMEDRNKRRNDGEMEYANSGNPMVQYSNIPSFHCSNIPLS